MSTVQKIAGVDPSYRITETAVPTGLPTRTIYSDAARTVVAAATAPVVAVAGQPNVFDAPIPLTLPAGHYYLVHASVFNGTTVIDNANDLILVAPGTTVNLAIVSLADYRRLARDTTSTDVDAAAALLDAQLLVEDYLRRPLALAVRTERLRLYMAEYIDGGYDGAYLCYPKATPISDAPGFTVLASNSVAGAFPDGGPFLQGIVGGGVQPYATITYTGGWTPDTLPTTIKREIARTAKAGFTFDTSPAGATSVRVGDVAVTSNPLYLGAALSEASKAALRPYRRRRGS